jgi:hypothetical protein
MRECPCSRCPIVRGRQNPSRPSVTAGQPRPVNLPGDRTREDGLDRTCPTVPELAAIGGMDASGQDERDTLLSLSIDVQDVYSALGACSSTVVPTA